MFSTVGMLNWSLTRSRRQHALQEMSVAFEWSLLRIRGRVADLQIDMLSLQFGMHQI